MSLSEPPPTDAAVAAVRALLGAATAPTAVFDADGACIAATPAYLLRAAGQAGAGAAERRVPFSPDGVRTWALARIEDTAGQPHAAELIDTIADALPILFNAKDAAGRILFMNRYQADMLGVSAAEAVGRSMADLPGAAPGDDAMDARVLRTGQPTPFYEESFAGADGRPRHWLTSKVPLRGPDGAAWGTATVAIDISERKALEERLRAAKEAAEVGSRAKSRFLATMSHELRTPLNAVIGFAEIMREEAMGPLGAPEYKEYAALIHRSGHALLDLISTLLDYARVEAGSLELSVGDVELVRALRSAANGARDEAANATSAPVPPLTLETAAPSIGLRADEQRLRQIFRALIGNALKFTPPGGQVMVRAAPLEGGGAEVIVADSGIGMNTTELSQVFEPFWQADSGLGRSREGAGIGLKLARELAVLHGGSLTLESAKGHGTRAILRLPPAPPPATA